METASSVIASILPADLLSFKRQPQCLLVHSHLSSPSALFVLGGCKGWTALTTPPSPLSFLCPPGFHQSTCPSFGSAPSSGNLCCELPGQHPAQEPFLHIPESQYLEDSAELQMDPQYREVIAGPIAQIGVPEPDTALARIFLHQKQASVQLF